MPELVIQLIIVLIVCGFLYWCWLLVSPRLPIAEPFLGWINVLFMILIGAIIIFYAVIPLLESVGHMHIGFR